MELYNALSVLMTWYITFNYALKEENQERVGWTISVVILLDLLLWICSRKEEKLYSSRTNYRQESSNGIFLTMVIPMTHLGELIAGYREADGESALIFLWLSLANVSAVVTRWMWTVGEKSIPYWFLLLASSVVIILHLNFTGALFLCVIDILIVWFGLHHISILLPKSFTFGELAIVLQLLLHFINRLTNAFLGKSWLTSETYPLLMFTCTLLTTVVIGTYIAYMTSSHLSVWRFILTYISVALAALLFLHVTMPQTPLLWLFHFATDDCKRVLLIVTWFLLLAISLTWTANQSLLLKPNKSTGTKMVYQQEDTSCSKKISAKFIARKMFHIFIVLVFIPGLISDPQLLFLASVAALGLFIIVEAARVCNVPILGSYINEMQILFVDDRDQGRIFLTHFYLLLGMSLPLWMSPLLLFSSKASCEMYSGVLALGVGDTVACLCGRAFGSRKWPGTKKTIEGTVCSVLAQMVLVTAGSLSGVLTITSISTILFGVILAALAEAFTDQIDNLLLPLFLYPVLCFS